MDLYIAPRITGNGNTPEFHKQILADKNGGRYVHGWYPQTEEGNWVLGGHEKMRERRCAVSETGFFWRSMHIDKLGLWHKASFNTEGGMYRVRSYIPPEPGADVLRRATDGAAKYADRAPEIVKWDGVVLACQQPGDRSITYMHHQRQQDDYWDFIEGACLYYGKNLFLKMHPCGQNSSRRRHEEIAKKYGCKIGYVRLAIIEKCKFVLVYCSSMAVDCWLRDVRVAQYAPGYFANTGAVTFTNGLLPDDVEDTSIEEQKMLNFLVWKYCFARDMRPKDMIDMFCVFANSEEDDLFPMREEHSYGANYELCEPISGDG